MSTYYLEPTAKQIKNPTITWRGSSFIMDTWVF